ncbi:galactose/methyl galactoside ABC transporter permease MglC [Brachyspira aalborgi]|uniref:Galactose/methyl galactoside ABC transporter permease MglC n=1 Tax=Brachyspira aalborgi TaxID=29522 RepID=A0A5C8G3T3_9SPIR|nr:galactose/methyl galactoside ABC transporter permease MglC [Brachyspira aalborgi]TXJ56339.1 galactose/methyl galactoside ABC transporter permease MglC [Brachyspira aalborgi]
MSEEKSNLKTIKSFILNNAIFAALLIILIGIIIKEPSFFRLSNFLNIFAQASTRMIIAVGIGTLLVTQGNDLGAGRAVGLAAVVSASLLQSLDNPTRMYPNLPLLPVILPILLVMIILMVFGLINGIIISKLYVTPFIATLGMQLILYGVTSTYFDRPPYGAQPIGGLDPRFTNLAQGGIKIGSLTISYLIIFAVIITFIMYIIWNKTKLGKNIFAVGGNPEAAAVSGVNIPLTLMIVYTMAGALYGIAGSLEVARVGSATNNLGNGYELDAIAACVVGGVSFSGGIGSILGIVSGVLIFQVINYGMSFVGISPYMQYIIKGAIIIAAVAVDTQKYLKKV